MHEKLSRQTQADSTTHSTDTAAAFIQHFINDCLLSNEVFPDLCKGFMDDNFTIKFSHHE